MILNDTGTLQLTNHLLLTFSMTTSCRKTEQALDSEEMRGIRVFILAMWQILYTLNGEAGIGVGGPLDGQ